jgi:hypothetical protein
VLKTCFSFFLMCLQVQKKATIVFPDVSCKSFVQTGTASLRGNQHGAIVKALRGTHVCSTECLSLYMLIVY